MKTQKPLIFFIIVIVQSSSISNNTPHPFPGVLVLVIIFLPTIFLVWKFAWPALKENNIFDHRRLYQYARGEEILARGRLARKDTLVAVFLVDIIGVGILIYQHIFISVQGLAFKLSQIDYAPPRLFGLGLLCTMGLFILALIDGDEFKLLRNYRYALKVWVTGVVVPAAILLLLHAQQIPRGWASYLCFKMLIMGSGLGAITFAGLLIATHYYTGKPFSLNKKRWHIMFAVQAVLLVNTALIARFIYPGHGWFGGWLCYAITVGLAIKFYEMDATIYSDEITLIAEVIDDYE